MSGNSRALAQRFDYRAAYASHKEALTNAQMVLTEAIPETLRRTMNPGRVIKVALMNAANNKSILKCTPKSVVNAVIQATSYGLDVGGSLGQAYIVPFKNKNLRPPFDHEATLIIGYRGFIAMARRSGEILSVAAHGVYDKDEFDMQLGDEPHIKHRPFLGGERGKLVSVYSVAEFKDGGRHTDFMTVADVNKIRSRSRASDNGPWKTDYDEMAKKTVVRRASKYWPLCIDLLREAMASEDLTEKGRAFDIDAGPPEWLNDDDEDTEGEIVDRPPPAGALPAKSAGRTAVREQMERFDAATGEVRVTAQGPVTAEESDLTPKPAKKDEPAPWDKHLKEKWQEVESEAAKDEPVTEPEAGKDKP